MTEIPDGPYVEPVVGKLYRVRSRPYQILNLRSVGGRVTHLKVGTYFMVTAFEPVQKENNAGLLYYWRCQILYRDSIWGEVDFPAEFWFEWVEQVS